MRFAQDEVFVQVFAAPIGAEASKAFGLVGGGGEQAIDLRIGEAMTIPICARFVLPANEIIARFELGGIEGQFSCAVVMGSSCFFG